MAGLFDARDVAELTPSGVFGVFAAHTASHECFDFFREVLLDLLGEIAVDLRTGEKLSQPTHDGPLRLSRSEDEVDAFEHLFEAGDFALQVLDARRCDAVGAHFAVAG